MPVVSVNMIEGRSDMEKEKLIKGIADVLMDTLGVPEQNVRVMINEYKKTDYGIGTVPAHKANR